MARRLNVATNLIHQWRRQALVPAGFVPAVVTGEGEAREVPSCTPSTCEGGPAKVRVQAPGAKQLPKRC